MLGYEKESGKNSFHCWLAGVDRKHRRQGIWKRLESELMTMLKARGYKKMTINTWPARFPVMYGYLTKSGYKQYRRGFQVLPGSKRSKAFFIKRLAG